MDRFLNKNEVLDIRKKKIEKRIMFKFYIFNFNNKKCQQEYSRVKSQE